MKTKTLEVIMQMCYRHVGLCNLHARLHVHFRRTEDRNCRRGPFVERMHTWPLAMIACIRANANMCAWRQIMRN